MGDIDKVRQIHSNWLEFIKKYYQYYYHGVSQRCVKDYYFIPYGFLVLKDKVIPPYWSYNFNGGGSYGNISVTKYYEKYRFYKENGTYGYATLAHDSTAYSGLQIIWKNPPQFGSIVYTLSVSNLTYGPNIPGGNLINQVSFDTGQGGYVYFSSGPQARFDHVYTSGQQLFYYVNNPYSERWQQYTGNLQDITVNYTIHWERLPDGRNYVVDSLGTSSYGTTIAEIGLLVRLMFYIAGGSNNSSLAKARISTLSGLKFYNVKYW